MKLCKANKSVSIFSFLSQNLDHIHHGMLWLENKNKRYQQQSLAKKKMTEQTDDTKLTGAGVQ